MRNHPILRVHYRDPSDGWEGVLVIDSLVEGSAIGGVRVSRTVDAGEVVRLARAMTLKNSVLDLHMGGAKTGIRYDPRSATRREALVRFFDHVRPLCERMYGFGPDLNTTAEELDQVAREVGLPSRMAGAARDAAAIERYHASLLLPLGPFSLGDARTGLGVAAAVESAARRSGRDRPLRVAMQGFGTVGSAAAWLLASRGHAITAVADAGGTYAAAEGLDVDALLAARRGAGHPVDRAALTADVKVSDRDDILFADCDVLVLAAVPDALREAHAGAVRAKIVVEGGNIAVTRRASMLLHGRGIPVVPDFIASGGAIALACGVLHLGFVHDDPSRLAAQVSDHIARATERAFDASERTRAPLRDAVLPEIGEVSPLV